MPPVKFEYPHESNPYQETSPQGLLFTRLQELRNNANKQLAIKGRAESEIEWLKLQMPQIERAIADLNVADAAAGRPDAAAPPPNNEPWC